MNKSSFIALLILIPYIEICCTFHILCVFTVVIVKFSQLSVRKSACNFVPPGGHYLLQYVDTYETILAVCVTVMDVSELFIAINGSS